jgi:hypothetical protein
MFNMIKAIVSKIIKLRGLLFSNSKNPDFVNRTFRQVVIGGIDMRF